MEHNTFALVMSNFVHVKYITISPYKNSGILHNFCNILI